MPILNADMKDIDLSNPGKKIEVESIRCAEANPTANIFISRNIMMITSTFPVLTVLVIDFKSKTKVAIKRFWRCTESSMMSSDYKDFLNTWTSKYFQSNRSKILYFYFSAFLNGFQKFH